MARLPDFAQGIVALDVGPWFGSQRQSLGRLDRRPIRRLPVEGGQGMSNFGSTVSANGSATSKLIQNICQGPRVCLGP